MRDRVRAALAAVTFLTAVPLGRRSEIEPRDLEAGALLFPVVGALVGALVAAAAWAASLVLPPFAAGAIGVGCGALATGVLHLDGLADVADGIGATLSGGDPAGAMRDPRLGVFGGAALVLDVLLKISVVSGLVAGGTYPTEAVAAGAVARVAPLAVASAMPYVGAHHAWTRGVAPRTIVAPSVLAAAIAIVAARVPVFAAIVVASVAASVLVGRWASVRLGGATGDVFGAVVELSETLGLTAALALR